jgi:hypothetical protein
MILSYFMACLVKFKHFFIIKVWRAFLTYGGPQKGMQTFVRKLLY